MRKTGKNRALALIHVFLDYVIGFDYGALSPLKKRLLMDDLKEATLMGFVGECKMYKFKVGRMDVLSLKHFKSLAELEISELNAYIEYLFSLFSQYLDISVFELCRVYYLGIITTQELHDQVLGEPDRYNLLPLWVKRDVDRYQKHLNNKKEVFTKN